MADELSRLLISIFLCQDDGTRPVFGGYELLQHDPAWRDQLSFHEYFHGDTGAGLGTSHQTGWAGLVSRPDRQARTLEKLPPGQATPL